MDCSSVKPTASSDFPQALAVRRSPFGRLNLTTANEAVYQIACFMVLREPTVWRWSHARHHTDTIIVGRDPEVVQPRPPNLLEIFLMFFGIKQAQSYISKVALHAVGRLTAEEETFIPKSEHGKVYWIARAHILIYVVFIGWAIYLRSILPLMYVGCRRSMAPGITFSPP